jgi:hypothetical protein
MNIPSPAITTAMITPQDPTRTATTTTTVTLPLETDAMVAPLRDFYKENDEREMNERTRKDKGTMATFVALGELVSEVFELVNDQACGDLVDGKADNDKRDKFLAYIGVDSQHRRLVQVETVDTFEENENRMFNSTQRVIPRRNLAPYRKKNKSGDVSSDSDTQNEQRDGPAASSAQSVASRTTIASRASKYFGESPLARRRRAKNVVLEAMRRSERNDDLSDPSFYTTDEGESGSRSESMYSTEEEDNDTAPQGGTTENKEADGNGAGKEHAEGDDAPRDDVDDTVSMLEAAAEFRDASFPPIVQKFHSVNPMKPTKISKYNKQWPPPLQYPAEAEDFEAFIDQIKNHRSSSPYRPTNKEAEENDNAKEETGEDDIVLTKVDIEATGRSETHYDDAHEEGDSPYGVVGSSSSAQKLSKRSKPRKSFWRPTVVQQVDEATVPIPLTADRLSHVEKNKKRVQRNFQLRVKHHQAVIVRQRLNRRQEHKSPPSQFIACD